MTWDPQMFEQCFRDCYPALVQFLHGLTGDRAAGEDVAQEAFIRLWSRGPTGRPDADYWLFRAARNLGLDWIKTETRRTERDKLAAETGDGPAFDAADQAQVHRAIAALPSRDREVLLLREFSEMSYEQIARVVGRSVNAVKQDLFRARQHLRQQWHAKFGGE
jgi:RNA polymerase sigma-70 factor (ECF subfamily)